MPDSPSNDPTLESASTAHTSPESPTQDVDSVTEADSSDWDDFHPYWVPPGLEIKDWSAELRAEVAYLINPLYHELVLQAKHALERSIGVTIVHLTWLEILDQLQIGHDEEPQDLETARLAMFNDSRPTIIERHLRLIGSKLRVSQFLLRLREFKSRRRKDRARASSSKHGQPHRRPFRKRER